MKNGMAVAFFWPGYVNFLWLYWAGRPCPMDESLSKALKELGVVGTNVDSHWSSHEFNVKFGFNFYVGHTAGKGWLYLRRADWKQVWDKYWRTRDKFVCIRPKCLSDPKTIEEMKAQIRKSVAAHKAARPLAYALDDEISYTSYTNPLDFCFSSHCLRRFRKWLRRRYRALEELNRTWGTSFQRWEEVVPLSTDEIREREYPKGMGHYNFSPWSDHLDFVDELFASVVAELVSFVHELDPGVPCGFVGGQAPSAWGGYDWWRLARVVDFLEVYDIGGVMEVVRSFAPARYPMVETIFVPPEPGKGRREVPRLVHKIWRGVAHGYFGHIIWCAHNYFPEGDPKRPS
ncbi:MAG TPA: hypothetical protein EYP65_03705, partial [Armatimonadetes bacterium]|nr:hypothetical protein [Armatimonadota bacterium]